MARRRPEVAVLESKVLEIFHYFNIEGGIDSIYGNWAVSQSGDVVNYLYSYPIFSIHLTDENWIEKLSDKSWFQIDCTSDLSNALERAMIISKNK